MIFNLCAICQCDHATISPCLLGHTSTTTAATAPMSSASATTSISTSLIGGDLIYSPPPSVLYGSDLRKMHLIYHLSKQGNGWTYMTIIGVLDSLISSCAFVGVKKHCYRIMLKKKVPVQLRDYGFSWVCETENICANLCKYADGRTPIEVITGETSRSPLLPCQLTFVFSLILSELCNPHASRMH